MQRWWAKQPEWIRWVFFVPVLLACQAVTMFTITWPAFLLKIEGIDFVFYRAFTSLIGLYVFAHLSMNLAPRHKRKVTWGCYIFLGIFCVIAIARYTTQWLESSLSWIDWAEFAVSVVWVIAGVPILRKVFSSYEY